MGVRYPTVMPAKAGIRALLLDSSQKHAGVTSSISITLLCGAVLSVGLAAFVPLYRQLAVFADALLLAAAPDAPVFAVAPVGVAALAVGPVGAPLLAAEPGARVLAVEPADDPLLVAAPARPAVAVVPDQCPNLPASEAWSSIHQALWVGLVSEAGDRRPEPWARFCPAPSLDSWETLVALPVPQSALFPPVERFPRVPEAIWVPRRVFSFRLAAVPLQVCPGLSPPVRMWTVL